jgi:hypothetical protein
MKSDPNGNLCIFYCKKNDPTNWNTMKLRRIDGVLVSAKTYDDVFKFAKFQTAFDFVKKLLTEEPEARYDAQIKRVCRARGDAFYLTGN